MKNALCQVWLKLDKGLREIGTFCPWFFTSISFLFRVPILIHLAPVAFTWSQQLVCSLYLIGSTAAAMDSISLEQGVSSSVGQVLLHCLTSQMISQGRREFNWVSSPFVFARSLMWVISFHFTGKESHLFLLTITTFSTIKLRVFTNGVLKRLHYNFLST